MPETALQLDLPALRAVPLAWCVRAGERSVSLGSWLSVEPGDVDVTVHGRGVHASVAVDATFRLSVRCEPGTRNRIRLDL